MTYKVWCVVITAALLAGCNASGPAVSLPTVVLNTGPGVNPPLISGVTASGVTVPAREAKMAFALGGTVSRVYAVLGDRVAEGQVLAELDSTAAARDLEQARRDLEEMTSPAALAEAKLLLADAQQAFQDAEAEYNNIVLNPELGALNEARERLANAKARYEYVLAHHDPGTSGQIQIHIAYQDYIHALQALQEAEANFNARGGGIPDPDRVDRVTAKYELASAQLTEARAYVDALHGGEISADATGARLARLKAARDRVLAAEERLNACKLESPFAGVVSHAAVTAGEIVLPGVVLFVISDTGRLRIETTDLSERDVPNVKIGQAASISIQALGVTVAGKVIAIAPLAETLGGDVVYRVIVELASQPDGLRAGMSVVVEIVTAP